jgi:hypothetical protein
VKSAVRTQSLHWNVPYVHKNYSGKYRTHTKSTVENAVLTQGQHESSVCDGRRRVVLNISPTTILTETDIVFARYDLRFWLTCFRQSPS